MTYRQKQLTALSIGVLAARLGFWLGLSGNSLGALLSSLFLIAAMPVSLAWYAIRLRPGDRCAFCDQHQDVVKYLIAGPRLFICDACVAICEGITGQQDAPTDVADAVRVQCQFCGAGRDARELMVLGARGAICGDCVHVCRDILDAEVRSSAVAAGSRA
jgi:hypothetical protein